MKVGILGTGNVGQALAKGLARRHEVRLGSRTPEKVKPPANVTVGTVREAADWADAVVLAVPHTATKDVVMMAAPGLMKDKVLIDATNPLTASFDWAVGFSTSAAEEIAKLVPGARVAKAFNSVFAPNMSTGKVGTTPLSLFVAGDDPKAKDIAMRLGRDIGFEPVDAGPLRSARYLEAMALQMITFAYGLKMGPDIGLKLVRK